MSRLQKIGKLVLAGVATLAFIGRQKLTFGVSGIYLNGIISKDLIPLRVVAWISNNTIASVLVRSLSGVLVCEGKTIASISQTINKRIGSKRYVEQDILIDIHGQEAMQSLYSNIQSGDINNLSFELIGEVVVGEQWPIGIKFNRVFTWAEIQQML